jgi:hypothetical protein
VTRHPQQDRSAIPERAYEEARCVCLSFRFHAGIYLKGQGDELHDRSQGSAAALSHTLAVLLREALPTIFPEMHPFLLICPTGDQANELAGESLLPHVLPSCYGTLPEEAFAFNVSGERDAGLSQGESDSPSLTVSLVAVEDSRTDLGLTRSVALHWEEMMEVVEDYLHWVTDGGESASTAKWTKNVTDPQAFLRYGNDTLGDALCLEAVRDLLGDLMEGRSLRLHQRRLAYYDGHTSDPVRQVGIQRCDFCGTDVSEAEYVELGDRRVRCETCTALAVDTEDELRAAYRDARAFLENDLGIDLARNIRVTLTDTEAVQRQAGRTFIPTSSFDSRVLGIATYDASGISILVENGQPYYMALAVIVHELTHVWQFDKLDFRRLQQESSLLVTEGHATWAELAVLDGRPEAEDYVQETKARTDVYGEGYRHVVEQLANTGFETPFAWLLNEYGRTPTAFPGVSSEDLSAFP